MSLKWRTVVAESCQYTLELMFEISILNTLTRNALYKKALQAFGGRSLSFNFWITTDLIFSLMDREYDRPCSGVYNCVNQTRCPEYYNISETISSLAGYILTLSHEP